MTDKVLRLAITPIDKAKAIYISDERAKLNRLNGRPDKSYETKKRSSKDTGLIGTLAEVVINKHFEVVADAPWIEVKPTRKYGYAKPDFRNHRGETIELKSTDKFYKNYVQINVDYYKRKQRHNELPDYFMFVEYNTNFKVADKLIVLGYLPSKIVPLYPVDPLKTDISLSYHIPKTELFKDVESIVNLKDYVKHLEAE